MAEINRKAFWQYCQRVHGQSAYRARRLKVPHTIDAHYIDRLLVDQKFCCAVSGIPLDISGKDNATFSAPFAPSLDRITPALGYVPGNLRVVCQIANVAMNEWGLAALEKLALAMACKISGEAAAKFIGRPPKDWLARLARERAQNMNNGISHTTDQQSA